jgi:hypothetical protein
VHRKFICWIITSIIFILILTSCSRTENGNLRVMVLGNDNVPLAGAKVISNTQPDGQLKITGGTQNDGVATYNDIKAGVYEFYISRFDYELKEFDVTVVTGRTTEITITLVRTSTP